LTLKFSGFCRQKRRGKPIYCRSETTLPGRHAGGCFTARYMDELALPDTPCRRRDREPSARRP